MTTIRHLLRTGDRVLHEAGIANARREAEWLLEYASGRSLIELLSNSDCQCPPGTGRAYSRLLRRRRGGEPFQHLTGSVDFYGYNLAVGPGVLIPRPETESLVEQALRLYPGRGKVCDVCTGSGAIAIVLACELGQRPDVVAVDLYAPALSYAAANRDRYRVENLHLCRADLFSLFRRGLSFSLITANPPYVTAEEYVDLPPQVRNFDPHTALVAGDQGMAMVRRVLREGYGFLAPDGWLLCEIGETQGDAAMALMRKQGYREVQIGPDLSGRPRMIIGRR